MSTEERKVPELRFKGFSDDWEQRKFIDIVDRISESTSEKNLPRVEYEDIVSGKGILNKNIFEKRSIKKGIKFIHNDILFGKLRPYLNKWLHTDFEGIAVGDFWVLRSKGIESLFLFYLLQTPRFTAIANLSSGTKMPRSDWKIVSNSYFFVPNNYHEEFKVKLLLQSIEKTIHLHQRRLNILNKIKKSYLEKMFVYNVNKTPTLRFKGFIEKWQHRKLGDLGEVLMNKRIYKNQTNSKGEIPFYKIGTFGKNPDSFISKELFDEYKNKYPYPKLGDILISASGTIGRTIVYNGEKAYFQDSNIVWLNTNEFLLNKYLKHFYSVIRWEGTEGSTIKRLYNSNIKNTKINLPCTKEQNKIGDFFDQLVQLTNLQHSKLIKLNELKKEYLNKMFI